MKNERVEARLVICGYSQVKELGCQDTSASTRGISIANTMLHISKVKGFMRSAFDFSGAFFEGKNNFPIHCYVSKDLRLTHFDILS